MRSSMRLVVAAVAAAVLGGTAPAVAQPAGAAPASAVRTVAAQSVQKPSNVYQVRARLKDTSTKKLLCLDADANHRGAGAAVRVLTCNGSNAQKWQLGQINGWNIWINLAHPGYALAADRIAVGAKLTLKRASGTDRTENFDHTNVCTVASCAILTSVKPHLAVEPRTIRHGSGVFLQRYEGLVATQSWILVRLS